MFNFFEKRETLFNIHVTSYDEYEKACFYLSQNNCEFESWNACKIRSKKQIENFNKDFQIAVTKARDAIGLFKYMQSLGFDVWKPNN